MEKHLKSLLAMLLIAAMTLSLLSACGKNNPDPEPEVSAPAQSQGKNEPETEPYVPDDLTAAGGFDDETEPVTEAPQPVQTDPVPEEETVLTYGGIPLVNVIRYVDAYATTDMHDLLARAFGENMANKAHDDYMSFAYMFEMNPDGAEEWLDSIFLEGAGVDTTGVSKAELDEARNMIVMVRAYAAEYIYDEIGHGMTLDMFLQETGKEVYDRWSAKLAAQRAEQTASGQQTPAVPAGGVIGQIAQSAENEGLDPGDLQTPEASWAAAKPTGDGHTTAPFEFSNLVIDSKNEEINGDVRIMVDVSCPDLIGGTAQPDMLIAFFDDNGHVIEVRSAAMAGNNDTGVYVCAAALNRVALNTDVPLEGHLYMYRLPEYCTISPQEDLTTADCEFVY